MTTDHTTLPPTSGDFRLFHDLRNKVWGLNPGRSLPSDKKGGPPVLYADAVLLRDVRLHVRPDTGWCDGTLVWAKSLRARVNGPDVATFRLADLTQAPAFGWLDLRFEMHENHARYLLNELPAPETVQWLLVSRALKLARAIA